MKHQVSPPPYELACQMLNAIGWNGNDFRIRDPVALAIAPEVERLNKQAKESVFNSGDLIHAMCGGNRIMERGKL
jgi:hypothetical protein